MISAQTAMDIALAYREIETAEKLLEQITETMGRRKMPDIRDAFGRLQDGLQLGVPSGESSQRMFNVPWSVVKPVIELHIAHHRARIEALNITAAIELACDRDGSGAASETGTGSTEGNSPAPQGDRP